jgi:hypothetical protein
MGAFLLYFDRLSKNDRIIPPISSEHGRNIKVDLETPQQTIGLVTLLFIYV